MLSKRSVRIVYTLLLVTAAFAVVVSPRLVPRDTVAASPPAVIQIAGTVRDFIEWNEPGGHPDFDSDGRDNDSWKGCGSGVYGGIVGDTLGADGRPVYLGEAFRVDKSWKDSSGRNICYALFDSALGDVPGTKKCTAADGATGGVESEASFDLWYRDVPGVNLSDVVTLEFIEQPDGRYLYDSSTDPRYSGGFFPIDNKLFGNSPHKRGDDHNYHFTFEMRAQFRYDAGSPQIFEFVGDDDLWMFIDGKKVIDLGGAHSAKTQYVDVSRPSLGLVDGEVYTLDIFFAERNRVQSNFRVNTSLELVSANRPTISAAYD